MSRYGIEPVGFIEIRESYIKFVLFFLDSAHHLIGGIADAVLDLGDHLAHLFVSVLLGRRCLDWILFRESGMEKWPGSERTM